MPSIQMNVGVQNQADGAQMVQARGGRQGELITSQLHGQYYEQTMRGNLFSNGPVALTALSANTISLTATTTPILGVYNPLGSGVNAVILRAALAAGINNAGATGPGIFVWASSTGNNALTTGSTPVPRLLGGAASKCKGVAGVALTGLSSNLVVAHSAEFPSPTVITTAAVSTAIQTPTTMYVEEINGAFIVPPGGILALLNTVSTTTISAHGQLLWEEVPI